MANLEIKKENIISAGNMTLFLCNFCNECYSQERSFKLHYLAHKNFPCDYCGKVFSLKRHLTVHRRSHESTREQFVCVICNKECNTKLRLQMHQRTHTEEKTHSCDICKRTFSNEAVFKKHYSTHTKKKPYVCNVCQKSFRQKSTYQSHSCTHTGKKPSIGDKTSKGTKELKYYRRIRTGDKKHVCNICQKTFISQAFLKSHYQCHKRENSGNNDIGKRAFSELCSSNNTFSYYPEREKPYVCHICQKAFSRKSSLVSHNCARQKKS